MASLNTSINGPSIKSSYSSVINGGPPSSDSPTHAHWALFSVQAPLLNAFQDSGAKESILKVQGTGESDLADLIEDFSEGRIQFAFAKIKDPNSGLPKNILIAWCGGGVPERTKGYFTSHLAAVSKILHGYHVQITARSESDLEIDSIMQKVADASGAKYSAGSSDSPRSAAPPPVKTKPVFTPTASSRANPLVAARSKREENVDEDGWGADAPPVTRTQIEKVESAYKPTKVNIADLSKQPTATTSGSAPVKRDDTPGDVVKGGYQPIGKVDIAAIRAQAQKNQDDRPTPVKGSYEPVGKVDIAAIRAQAKPAASEKPQEDETRPVSERMSAFSQPAQSERLTSLPKPKVANKFGGAGGFSGTKAPTPGGLGFGAPAPAKSASVGAASRTFADQGGKTPAQLWAERKARERGEDTSSTHAPAPVDSTSPVQPQKSGSEWKSGYSGKTWAPVQTGDYGRGVPGQISQENTGEQPEDTPASPSGLSALRDRFKDTAPISAGAPPPPAARSAEDDTTPPPVPSGRPSGGFALPGLPSRPAHTDEQDDEREDPSAYQTATERERSPSPPRVAVPVSRGPVPEVGTPPEQRAPPPITPSQIDVPKESDLADDKEVSSTARFAGGAAAGIAVGAAVGVGAAAAAGALEREPSPEPEPEPHRAPEPAAQPAQESQGGYRAVIQYDYEKAEDNEIDLIEGDIVTNIDMVDEDWWMGTNSRGESGLFPSNYVELVGDDDPEQPAAAAAPPPPPTPPIAEPEPEPETQAPAAAAAPAEAGHTAVALYDYEAAEDNELSFPEDATITNLEFPDEDWWFGHYAGQAGLFPANYVQLNQ
ncbi:hypothetical protein H9Q70_013437 [Fusarium xylarioides]|nr:hypothetical protein H9Q70_013437 [Fusarium xylarioides]KAG5771383.1 hypothetical protein H9Q73_012893 [Fusarium xylarioides]